MGGMLEPVGLPKTASPNYMCSLSAGTNCLNSEETTQLRRKSDMEKRTDNRALNPKPMTHALTQILSHASYGIGHAPSSHIAACVPVAGVPNTRLLKTCDLKSGTCMLDGSCPASLLSQQNLKFKHQLYHQTLQTLQTLQVQITPTSREKCK